MEIPERKIIYYFYLRKSIIFESILDRIEGVIYKSKHKNYLNNAHSQKYKKWLKNQNPTHHPPRIK